MEGVMAFEPRETIERANARLGVLLEDVRQALRGERDFDAADVRRLREPIGEMDAIAAQSSALRSHHPELGPLFDLYKSRLRALQTLVVQIRIMLHTRQLHLTASHNHNSAVTRWVGALRQTR